MFLSRSIISGVLALSIVASATPAAAKTYNSSTRYRNNPIGYVQDQGYMTGYDNGSFGAGNTLNRAEFAKVVTLVDNGSNLRYSGSWDFWDADQNAWYAPYIRYVNDRGYMTGYNSRSFGPDRDVTFEEAAKVLAMVFDLNYSSGSSSRWSDRYVRALADRKAIPTSISDVDDELTRGELADIVYRLDTNDRTRSSQSYSDLIDNNDHCYYDQNRRYHCDDYDDYNYDTYYQDNDCYYDNRGRYICSDDDDCYYDSNNRYRCDDDNDDDCYYDANGRYRCDDDDDDDCYYDANGRYRCDDDDDNDCYYDNNGRYHCDDNDDDDCYYDSNNRYRCDDDDDDGDCVYDSDGRRVCGTADNSSGCYYDTNGRYRCSGDDRYQDSNCYYDNRGRYQCDDDNYNDYYCYYDNNGRYRCDDDYNDDDDDDCYYDSNNRYVCY